MPYALRGEAPGVVQRVNELHVWIAVHEDGSEGILSMDLPADFGTRHMPLMSSQRSIAENMRPAAMRIARDAAEAGRPVRHELRSFFRRA